MLEDFGILYHWDWSSGISPEEEENLREVAASSKQADILMHARAKKKTFCCAIPGWGGLGGHLGICNPISLQTNIPIDPREYAEEGNKTCDWRSKILRITGSLTIEMLFGTEWKISMISEVWHIKLGAIESSVADTVGIGTLWMRMLWEGFVERSLWELKCTVIMI